MRGFESSREYITVGKRKSGQRVGRRHRALGREKDAQRREHWHVRTQGISEATSVVGAVRRGRALMEIEKNYIKNIV